VRSGKGRDDFGQGPKVKVDQATDGVVMEICVVLTGQRTEAARAIERVGTG
jgi:hypothetical protein